MMNTLPVLLKDGYKVGHVKQYPEGTELVYSNLTPRKSRVKGIEGVIAFGFQYFVFEYLVDQFNLNFFSRNRESVVEAYQRRIDNYLGPGTITYDHIADLHALGYVPIRVKAVPEGTLVPFRVPVLTIQNTVPEFYWLTNMLETLISNILWLPMTSATTAFMYRRNFEKYVKETGADLGFIPWQGHDFSMRGMAGIEAAALSGAGHLLSFTGTDTLPAIELLEDYYEADAENELIGGSVAATEHSVMSMGMQDGEFKTFKRLITQVVPKGIVSIVSDTWDLFKVLTVYLPALKDDILAREGKVVIRPDSGDPTDILCGDPDAPIDSPEYKGVVRLLWEIFGGTVNEAGFKVLDPHIGAIYGDSITLERQETILRELKVLGFASSNVVFGIGSYTYQYVTRDTFGFAMKATYGVINGMGQDIYKEPKTDDGTKNSARGLLAVYEGPDKKLYLQEKCTPKQEEGGLLQVIFEDSRVRNIQSLKQIRERVASYL